MRIGAKPTAEVTIDSSVVRALLQQQHADLAHLPLIEVAEGWDNTLFRLGEDLAVRLPRRAASAALIEHEQQWLPKLSPQLPLPVPVPLRIGRPGAGFPWSWSVVPWLRGHSALVAPPRDQTVMAVALVRFLRALHQSAPQNAPSNPLRGVPLAARTESMQEHLRQLDGLVDRRAVLRLWERVLSTPRWSGAPLWIHGDLHPGNLLVDGSGRLSAVIDFGDLAAGDPATDLAVLWMLLPPSERAAFLTTAREELHRGDDHTVMRARGWALALGLAFVASSREHEAMRTLGRATIDNALSEPPE